MNDAVYMQRALALAAPGIGQTGDNPSVGCLIVKDGAVIGEGATGAGGRPHAEEVALAEAGDAAQGAVAYVTLEPCAQRSAGGYSCSYLLLIAGVVRVVVATRDPHPLVAGAGVKRLRSAGVAVEVGLLESEARLQNSAFFARWDNNRDGVGARFRTLGKQSLITLRWLFLVSALGCGLAMFALMYVPSSQYWNVQLEMLAPFSPFLQGAGTFGVASALTARGVQAKLSVDLGYLSAMVFLVGVIGAWLVLGAGASGSIWFSLVLPSPAFGLLMQVVAFFGFVRAEQAGAPSD